MLRVTKKTDLANCHHMCFSFYTRIWPERAILRCCWSLVSHSPSHLPLNSLKCVNSFRNHVFLCQPSLPNYEFTATKSFLITQEVWSHSEAVFWRKLLVERVVNPVVWVVLHTFQHVSRVLKYHKVVGIEYFCIIYDKTMQQLNGIMTNMVEWGHVGDVDLESVVVVCVYITAIAGWWCTCGYLYTQVDQQPLPHDRQCLATTAYHLKHCKP